MSLFRSLTFLLSESCSVRKSTDDWAQSKRILAYTELKKQMNWHWNVTIWQLKQWQWQWHCYVGKWRNLSGKNELQRKSDKTEKSPSNSIWFELFVRKYFWNHFIEYILSSNSRFTAITFCIPFAFMVSLFFFVHLSPNSECMYGMRKWISVQHTCSISFHIIKWKHTFLSVEHQILRIPDTFLACFYFLHLFVLSDELMCLWMPVLSKCWH